MRGKLARLLAGHRLPKVVRLLSEPRWYLAEIDRLHVKHSLWRSLYEARQDGVPFAAISFDRKRLARVLADTVSRGAYVFEPGKVRQITVRGKERVVYAFRNTDRIVHGAVSAMLTEFCRPLFVPGLYSYLKGKNWCHAVTDLARYTRLHRRERRDPKDRGLFVIRRDVRKYTDTIPVGDASPLWPILDELLRLKHSRRDLTRFRDLVKQIIRPEFRTGGGLAMRYRGVPTGSPISTLLFNGYLTPLDRALHSVPGAFYARYSDDFIFAHPDPSTVQAAERTIDDILGGLQLTTNDAKDYRLYFNGASRDSAAWPEARGVNKISFLGCDVAFDATVSLGKGKVRDILRDIDARARRTYRLLDKPTATTAGPLVCAAINSALNPDEPSRHKAAIFLRRVITDRDQLKRLDYQIARVILRVLTGSPSAKAFRSISYRTLRKKWRLVSLYHARNRVARGA